jgi:hypothetical protein
MISGNEHWQSATIVRTTHQESAQARFLALLAVVRPGKAYASLSFNSPTTSRRIKRFLTTLDLAVVCFEYASTFTPKHPGTCHKSDYRSSGTAD